MTKEDHVARAKKQAAKQAASPAEDVQKNEALEAEIRGSEDKDELAAFVNEQSNDADLRQIAEERLQELNKGEQDETERVTRLVADIESSEDMDGLQALAADDDQDDAVQQAAAARVSQLDQIAKARASEDAAEDERKRNAAEPDPKPTTVAEAVQDDWVYDPENPGENPSTLAFRYRTEERTGLVKLQRWSGTTFDWEDAGAFEDEDDALSEIEDARD
jgi:hypothetical protein